MYVHTFVAVRLEDLIKQKHFNSEYHKLAVNLFVTSSWLSGIHHQIMKRHGLTMQQFNLLRILRGQKGKALSVNDLIERMIDKSSNASRLVDKLNEKGLVQRAVCPNDRRQVEVTITEQGLELLAVLDPELKEIENVLAGITPQEAGAINEMLDRIRTVYLEQQQTPL